VTGPAAGSAVTDQGAATRPSGAADVQSMRGATAGHVATGQELPSTLEDILERSLAETDTG
jgi:hypothetical protein